MKNTIMTEKIARRGVTVPHEYAPDFLESILARRYCNRAIVTVAADDTVASILAKFESGTPEFSHQGYPVVDATGSLIGVLTRRDFAKSTAAKSPEIRVKELVQRKAIVIFEDQSLRAAADIMTSESIGRVVVVAKNNPLAPKGIITRSDLLSAHQTRLNELKRSKNRPAALSPAV